MSATVRKNFVFRKEVASRLEEMTKENSQSMTSLVEEMIEDRYGSKRVLETCRRERQRTFCR